MLIYSFYAGITEANRTELDSTFDGSFMNYEIEDTWALLSSAHHTTRKTTIGSTATRSVLNMWCAAGIYP
jgi:hypothetical protein